MRSAIGRRRALALWEERCARSRRAPSRAPRGQEGEKRSRLTPPCQAVSAKARVSLAPWASLKAPRPTQFLLPLERGRGRAEGKLCVGGPRPHPSQANQASAHPPLSGSLNSLQAPDQPFQGSRYARAWRRCETLRFHPEIKGAQVCLCQRGLTAWRRATFHDGIVFSHRPVRPGERVALRVLCTEDSWCGGLRVGFTRLNPASAPCLPPFVCPDLEEQSPTWAAMLPEGCSPEGTLVRFWVNSGGKLFAKVNRGPRVLLRRGVRMGAPLWAVMDVYGTTKAIELLDPKASLFPTTKPWLLSDDAAPEPEARAGEECAICFHHAANTCLIPCGHTYFCSSCAWRVFLDTAKCPICRWAIEEVTLT
ncbi:E3 ubiquitin-protein ligase NEURL3 [Rhynchocyon petersi]